MVFIDPTAGSSGGGGWSWGLRDFGPGTFETLCQHLPSRFRAFMILKEKLNRD